VAEEAWRGGLEKTEASKKREKAVMGEFTGFFQAVDCFIGPKETVGSPRSPICLGEGGEAKAGEDLGGVVVKEYFDKGRVGVGST